MFETDLHGAVEVVRPGVALNRDTTPKLYEAVVERRRGGQPMVVIDMSQVPLVDSAGLEALLDVRDVLGGLGGAVKLASLTPLCRDALRVTGLADLFESYKDANAAVRSFLR